MMTCQNYKELMMGYLDNELDEQQRIELEEHLKKCPNCAAELEEFRKLKQLTDEVSLVEPEDKVWQQYWQNVYNRFERQLGWILFSIASVFLLIYGGFKAIEQLINNPAISVILKVGLLALIAGLAMLFVSVLRERLYFWKKDRYRNIRR